MRKHRSRKRRYHSVRVIKKLIKLSKEYSSKPKFIPVQTFPEEIYLSSSDKITHLSLVAGDKGIVEVTNVSYEIRIAENWITIVRYDSVHGYLHRHKRISVNDSAELIDREGVKRKGNPGVWYTWSIKDIQKRFLEYRAEFAKRSKLLNLGY